MVRRSVVIVVVLFVASLLTGANAQTATPQDNLRQYVADLQKTPDDVALREKIIKHVQTMNAAPAIPEAAREHFIMAQTLQKKASNTKSYALAADEYRAALLVAPWWPEAYNNLGVLLELAGDYDQAMQALQLYLLTNPADSRAAQDKIYSIKAAKKMAAVEAEVAQKKNSDDYLGGKWWAQTAFDRCEHHEFHLEGDGQILVQEDILDSLEGECRPLAGTKKRQGEYRKVAERVFQGGYNNCCTYEFLGDTLVITSRFSNEKSYWKRRN